jgi:tetratricopeptide (TPR) repeat protein
MTTCPSDQSLKRLGTVAMSDAEFAAMEKHVEQCGGCQAILERLARNASEVETALPLRLAEPIQTPALDGFVVEHELGRGSMGVVYRAWQPDLARHVAIKFLKRAASAQQRARWLREAQALSRVRNRGIVQIYEIGESEGWLYLVLELIRGGSLKDRLANPLPPSVAARFAETMTRAMAEVHKAGLLHLDLKPSNVLLDGPADAPWEEITPLIGDFGIARLQDDPIVRDVGARSVEGTPSYMAPEQIEPQRGPVGPPADVYAVGATLYHVLTGRPPFLAATVKETLDEVCQRDPVPPRQLVASIPRDLETICLKCLQKSPKDRYASAAALADDLRRFLEGEPVKARPLGPLGRAWLWCRRKPGIATLAAVLLLSLVGGFAGVSMEWRNAEAARKIALANAAETEDLLLELIQSHPVDPGHGASSDATIIDSLHKAEAHCRALLQKNPSERKLRIALTDVYKRLGSLYGQRGQTSEAEASYRQAQALWEPLATDDAGDPDCRYWLAMSTSWAADLNSAPHFQSLQRAEGILQKLADEQAANFDVLQRIWITRSEMLAFMGIRSGRQLCLGLLEGNRNDLEQRVRQKPADRPLRKRLALCYFLLGELSAQNGWASQAATSWRKSYESYQALAHENPDDLLDKISLAISCSRLIQDGPSDPYYVEAVPLLEQADARLKSLTRELPAQRWLVDLLLKNYCCLAQCHVKAGQAAKAVEASNDCLKLIATPLDKEGLELRVVLEHVRNLTDIAYHLRDAGQTDAARKVARQAAAICSELARDPSPDVGFFHDFGVALAGSSALANQLGETALALQQAELCQRAYEEWLRRAPVGQRHDDVLGGASMRIGKAHWSAGHRDKALAALRESAAIYKRIFERDPSNHVSRVALSQSYDRLVFYASRAGELRLAADTISERTRLWPTDATQQAQSAEDFETLAEQVATRNGGHLSREDRAERDDYLAESRRLRPSAKAPASHPHQDLSTQR